MTNLVKTTFTGEAEQVKDNVQPHDPALGKWYWMDISYGPNTHHQDGFLVKVKKTVKTLLCVTDIGTNYVELATCRRTSTATAPRTGCTSTSSRSSAPGSPTPVSTSPHALQCAGTRSPS